MFPDLRNALFTGGTFVHTVQGNNAGLLGEGFKILHKHIAPGAMHNSGNLFEQPKCHPKTRLAVLRIILHWIQNFDEGPSSDMMWLHGSTGVGKTAIARSISEHCEESGILLATFFFSRNGQGRNDIKQFVSTIAYQLTQTIPSTLQFIERAVEKDPSIFDKTLKHQVQTLIVHPLKLSNNNLPLLKKPSTPYLLVIDGLDECDDALAHIQVLKILGSLLLQHQLPLKILIVSRPERHIRSAFETGSLCKLATRLALDDSFKPDDDIRLFLLSEFDDIKETHPFRSRIPTSWPLKSIIEDLVKKSAGRFAVAAALIRFVASFDHLPHERLKEILAFNDNDCTLSSLLEFLDERRVLAPLPPPPHHDLLVLSDLPNSHVSSPSALTNIPSSSPPSDEKDSHLSFRRCSVSPLPSHRLSKTEEFQRASSEPSGTGRLWRSTPSRHVKKPAAFSCPIPGCGVLFTRYLNFKVHLRTHKEEKRNNNNIKKGYHSPSSSSSGHSSSSKPFVKHHLDRNCHEPDMFLPHGDHLQSFQCMGCRRQFPQLDALDRHLNSEIGVECMKVVGSCKMDVQVAPPSQHCWEMELMDTEMDVEVDKGIGTTEMEVD